MGRLVEKYLRKDQPYRVVDFGSRPSRRQVMTHRDLFAGYECVITGVDVRPGRNVDLVMKKPYRVPLKSGSADVVISGQVFEHVPFFWASLLEITRIIKPNGYFFLTVPSRGHVHTSVDCWRYYPDGLRAMAAFSGLKLCEAHTDFPPITGKRLHDYRKIDVVNRYWGDTVGVFQKPSQYPSLQMSLVREVVVWWANRVGALSNTPTD
jgi:SAM-dependent methyltransferase